jgi:NitT/TauT family transport system permease protein
VDLTIPIATLATVGRIFLLIAISIITGWAFAYVSVRNRKFESFYIPAVNVLESIPVVGFLPVVLIAFVLAIPNAVGVELAVDFLVFDAVVWNIWIGIYQAFKTVPENLLEVADNYNFGFLKKMKGLYIPHSIPRITSNLFSSFADAFFYISVSEVFTAGAAAAKVCPSGICQTFGIGTLITKFMATGDYTDVYYSLAAIAVAVTAVTLALSRASRWAVAKYGIDTPGVIRRYAGRWRGRIVNPWRSFLSQGRVGLSRVSRRTPRTLGRGAGWHADAGMRYLMYSVLAFICAYVAYTAAKLVLSVPAAVWLELLMETPLLLEFVAADYARVSIIALASLGFAVSMGYFLATHKRAGDTLLPVIQMIAAFPAPTYFPLIFIATLPVLEHILPFLYVEAYIFMLGFLSCFYYVFFDFWIGVQAIPSEFVDLMKIHSVPFLTRMKRVILPSCVPYIITGLSSTINSAWAGIAIGEFWPDIAPAVSPGGLQTKFGMMYYISANMANGEVTSAAYVSLLFAVVVAVYGIVFTRNLMDVARKKYVIEEGIFAA